MSSRANSALDAARLSKAVERPGIDPRTWVSLAIVTAVRVEEGGAFVDIELLPSEDPETAYVGSSYAGDGFGDWDPIAVDDLVLVEVANGAPDAGLVVTKRIYYAGAKVPQEALDNPDDKLIHVKPGQSLRIVVSNGGKVIIDGEAVVGSGSATEEALLGKQVVDSMQAFCTTCSGSLDPAVVSAAATLSSALAAWKAQKVKVY